MIRSLLVLSLVALVPVPLGAQVAGEGPLVAVQRLFDAMRQRDTAAMRALLHPDARLFTAGRRHDQPALRVVAVEDWLSAVGRASVELDERIWDPKVEIDHELATVWVKYEFVAGGTFSHCGVDAFQLFRGADGWRIFQVADTQRREDCWHRPG
jgi:ketosteroid isomerase-like protein